MTQPALCDSCGTQTGGEATCTRCQAEQQRLASNTARKTTERVGTTTVGGQEASAERLRQRLAQAHRDLTALPDLVDTLARCLTEKPPAPTDGGSGGGGKPGSKPPVRLEVMHLVDEREKPLWWGEDPRDAELGDRYGVAWQLHAWSRVVWEEWGEYAAPLANQPTAATESAYLLAAFGFIAAQRWAADFAADVTALAARCRDGLGIRREYRPSCRYCHDVVEPVNTQHETTDWNTYAYALCRGCGWQYRPGAELIALGQVQQAMPLGDVARHLGIALPTLYRWWQRGVFAPAVGSPKRPTNRKPAIFDLEMVYEKTALLRTSRSVA